MFNRNSATVKIWYGAVMIGQYTIDQVPKLSNLATVVRELYDEAMGAEEVKTPETPAAQ